MTCILNVSKRQTRAYPTPVARLLLFEGLGKIYHRLLAMVGFLTKYSIKM